MQIVIIRQQAATHSFSLFLYTSYERRIFLDDNRVVGSMEPLTVDWRLTSGQARITRAFAGSTQVRCSPHR